MSGTTVRVNESTHTTLQGLALEEGETLQATLEKAVEEYRRTHFWKGVHAAAFDLRQNPAAWSDELAERTAWEPTLSDGIDPA